MSARVHLDPVGLARFKAIVDEKVGNLTEDIAEDARALAPVDTGELRASIRADRSAGEVHVGTDHWRFQEYGTRYQKAQPFMRPALMKPRAVR